MKDGSRDAAQNHVSAIGRMPWVWRVDELKASRVAARKEKDVSRATLDLRLRCAPTSLRLSLGSSHSMSQFGIGV
jgi:hypothetical protein